MGDRMRPARGPEPDTRPASSAPPGSRAELVTVIAVLAVSNVLANRVLPEVWYVPANLLAVVVVVWLGRRVVADDELGLGQWRRGAAFGAVLAAATAVVMLVALAMPVFRQLYQDRRVDGEIGAVLVQALVRAPFGTVLLEEVAFRSVVPALAAQGRVGRPPSVLRGSVVASVLFGWWHVLPAWNLTDANDVAGDVFGTGAVGTTLAVLFAVAGTTVAGLWWCWIRYRSGSVLSTVIAHTATNSIGYLLAYAVTR